MQTQTLSIQYIHVHMLNASKIRPLLITLVNESSAAELIQCAPLLRQSSEATGIYINADLTAAEALAGFQARERRRARRAARVESVPSTSVAVRPTTDPTTCSPVSHWFALKDNQKRSKQIDA